MAEASNLDMAHTVDTEGVRLNLWRTQMELVDKERGRDWSKTVGLRQDGGVRRREWMMGLW